MRLLRRSLILPLLISGFSLSSLAQQNLTDAQRVDLAGQGHVTGAYYDYEIDANRNWTHRVIWVWSRSLGERKVYETDSRTISYWPR